MARRIWTVLLIVIPLAVLVLWMSSGREVLTKSTRWVDVQVQDPLFGLTDVRKTPVPGPIFGYYVGLDLVLVVAAACLVAWAASLAVRRWRRRRGGLEAGGPPGRLS